LELEKIIEAIYKTSKKIFDLQLTKNTTKTNLVNLGLNIIWDKDSSQLSNNSDIIKLSKKEILLIELLVSNGDKVSTIDEIFHTIWEENSYQATLESLKAIISRFRKKVPSLDIENIYGLGYRIKI